MHIEGTCILSSSCEKLLGITIDSDFMFVKRISGLCDKVNRNINALCQITGYMSLEQRSIVIKITSHNSIIAI